MSAPDWYCLVAYHEDDRPSAADIRAHGRQIQPRFPSWGPGDIAEAHVEDTDDECNDGPYYAWVLDPQGEVHALVVRGETVREYHAEDRDDVAPSDADGNDPMTDLCLVALRSPFTQQQQWTWKIRETTGSWRTLACNPPPRGRWVPAAVRDELAKEGLVAVFIALSVWCLQPLPAAPEAA